MYDHILVPTDGSDEATAAAEEAIRLADQVGATLHVVYVVDESASSLLLTTQSMEEALESMVAAGSEATASVVEMATDAGVPVESETIRGMHVHEGIVEYAQDHGIDLIVMGTTGRHGVEYVVGSTTERVLGACPVPVLAVSMTDRAQAARESDAPGDDPDAEGEEEEGDPDE